MRSCSSNHCGRVAGYVSLSLCFLSSPTLLTQSSAVWEIALSHPPLRVGNSHQLQSGLQTTDFQGKTAGGRLCTAVQVTDNDAAKDQE